MSIKTEGIKVTVNSKVVGCLYKLGAIKLERESSEKKCMSEGVTKTILGAIKTGDIDLSVAYDPTDTAGKGELESVFNSNSPCEIKIELSDTAGTNGTTFTWSEAGVKGLEIDPDSDGEVGANFTLVMNGKPTVTPAA